MKTKIISCFCFFIIIAIIIIALIMCAIRYTDLYPKSMDNLIENYSKLNKINNLDGKIIIAYEIRDNNFTQLEKFIKSILNQNVKVDGIYAIITNEKINDKMLPPYIKKTAIILPSIQNYGDYSSILISMLLKENISNTNILFLDSYFIYEKKYIDKIVNFKNKNKNCIILDSLKNNTTLLCPGQVNYENIKREYDKQYLLNFLKNYKTKQFKY